MSFTISPDTVTPEFLAQDSSPSLIATASLMMISCTVFVGLRYWARYLNQTSFGAEDVMIPFAWMAELGLCIVGIVMVKHAGVGRHTIVALEQDPSALEKYLKLINVNEFLHPAGVAFPKICVVLLYLRVFTNKYERMAAWVLIGIVSATWFSYTAATIFQCRPIAFAWDKSIPGGECFNFTAFATSSSVPNIVTDVAVLFLPIRTITELKISIGRKAGLMLIFLTGSVGIIASIIRTAVFASTDPLNDPTFTAIALLNWTIIEPGLYLLAACALSFKPLFRMLARALHLNHLVTTHTKSSLGKTNHSTAHHYPAVIRMETFKSASSGGFSKLSEGKDGDMDISCKGETVLRGKDVEDGVMWTGEAEELEERYRQGVSEGIISVMVTRTVEVESESWPEEERATARDADGMRFDKADQTFFVGLVDGLGRRDERAA